MNRRLVDGESINWGTRLTPVLSATSLLSLNLDMGYVHPNDHRYQTVVLYNRNPVSVEATIRSSNLPHVSFYPIFRAQLNNQTASEASLPNRFRFPIPTDTAGHVSLTGACCCYCTLLE